MDDAFGQSDHPRLRPALSTLEGGRVVSKRYAKRPSAQVDGARRGRAELSGREERRAGNELGAAAIDGSVMALRPEHKCS
jgi:hypothetical protein